MQPVAAALAVCGLVLGALPIVDLDATNAAAEEAASQDAPMSREERIQAQRGLAALGFDPGPADGLFGPKTRAAIWDWQTAKGLEASGFLTRAEAEALGAMGQAAEGYDEESDPEVAEPDEAAFEERAPEPSGSPNRVLYFPQCSGLDELPLDEPGCWKAISNHQECDLFLPRSEFSTRKKQFAWSGDCQHNAAHGKGTLTWDSSVRESGLFVEGKKHGDWVLHARTSGGIEDTAEVHYVDGERHGHWVIQSRHPDGTEETQEGLFVDDVRHGRWVYERRYPDGPEKTTEEHYLNGILHGGAVIQTRYPDGAEETHEVPYVDGERHGRYVLRYRYADGTENTMYWECHHGECEEQ